MTLLAAEGLNGKAEQDVFAQKVIGIDPSLLEVGNVQLVIGEFVFLLGGALRASLAI